MESVTIDGITMQSSEQTPDELRASLHAIDQPSAPEAEQAAEADAEAPAEPTEAEREAGKTLAARKNSAEKRKASIQSQIDELVRQREAERGTTAAARAEREALSREIDLLKQQRESLKAPAPTEAAQKRSFATMPDDDPADPKPKQGDFDEYEDFVEARGAWAARRVFRAEQVKARDAHQRSLQTHAQRERLASYTHRLEAARSQHADFDARVDVDLPLTLPMQDVIMDSEIGPEIMLHLAEHPEEAEQIRALPSLQAQFRAMSRLEGRLEAARVSGPAPKSEPKSQAKPPIKPLGSTPGAVVNSGPPDPETCTQAEYDAYWNKHTA